MQKDAKTTYAQSSDIKSRTYIEYRRDMKKKAIAELESADWIRDTVQREFPGRKVRVNKSGGDKFIWFLRKGGVTRDPDYEAQIDGERLLLEFQYADREDLPYYDFKLSKVGRKVGGQRVPHKDRAIIYIMKPLLSYAFLTPSWIADHGQVSAVPAWRSQAYRVPRGTFLPQLQKDPALADLISAINAKNAILQFQHELVDLTKDQLSYLLQAVIDDKKLVTIAPNDLDGFFKVCFILENIDRTPLNVNLWLVYLGTYLDARLHTETAFKVSYCLDFLYSRATLQAQEIPGCIRTIKALTSLVQSFAQADGSFESSPTLSPLQETRFALFSLNVLEDITQDIIHYYDVVDLDPITKIYETVPFLEQTAGLIASSRNT